MPGDAPQLSFVIPCHNEEANLRPLVTAIRDAVTPLNLAYEIVVTDDCSTDQSWAVLKELQGNPLFDADGTQFVGTINLDEQTGTFTFSMTVKLKRPIKLY